MKHLPRTEDTLLVRTDFSDEAAWRRLRTVVTTPSEEDGFLAALHIVDDPAHRGLATAQVVALLPDEESLLILADATALGTPDLRVLAVSRTGEEAPATDPETSPDAGFDTLRVVAAELWSVENNLALANMDWEEFVDAAGDDGVFRGFEAE